MRIKQEVQSRKERKERKVIRALLFCLLSISRWRKSQFEPLNLWFHGKNVNPIDSEVVLIYFEYFFLPMTAGKGGCGNQETLRVAAGVVFPLRAGVCRFSGSRGGGRRCYLVLGHFARPQRVTLPACPGCPDLHRDCPGLHPSQCPPGSAWPFHPRPPMTAHSQYLTHLSNCVWKHFNLVNLKNAILGKV